MSTPTLIMGVLNVTPDSFSDGGKWTALDAAVAHAEQMRQDGAAIIDVGGESTRPGAERPSVDEEIRRVIPVVTRLVADGHTVSVDTMRHQVAEAALEVGAHIINDVSGGLSDPQMLEVVAGADVDYLCQHWRGYGDQMHTRAVYDDVIAEVTGELTQRIEACLSAGIAPERLIIDPGFGFAKDAEHDWAIVQHFDAFTSMGFRVLAGPSRKRFLGLTRPDSAPTDRDVATATVSALCAMLGAWGVRVHNVRATADALAAVELSGLRACRRAT